MDVAGCGCASKRGGNVPMIDVCVGIAINLFICVFHMSTPPIFTSHASAHSAMHNARVACSACYVLRYVLRVTVL